MSGFKCPTHGYEGCQGCIGLGSDVERRCAEDALATTTQRLSEAERERDEVKAALREVLGLIKTSHKINGTFYSLAGRHDCRRAAVERAKEIAK